MNTPEFDDIFHAIHDHLDRAIEQGPVAMSYGPGGFTWSMGWENHEQRMAWQGSLTLSRHNP